MKRAEETDRVREHYGKAAINRYTRLKTDELNPARHNHNLRFSLISKAISDRVSFEKGIDIGTGTGVWAEFLTKHCSVVDGVDFVEENVAIARENSRELGLQDRISYFQDDVESLSFARNEDYDVALMISVLQHLPDKEKGLKRVHEILKFGGRFILLVHNRRCVFNYNLWCARRSGTELPINEYSTLREIEQQLLEAGFCVQKRWFTWLFFTDAFFLGRGRLLSPIRRVLLSLTVCAESRLSHFTSLDFLFREIVLVCSRSGAHRKEYK